MNNVTITGRIGQQVEAKISAKGTSFAQFSLGVDGFRTGTTDWIACVAFGPVAEALVKTTNVGDKISIVGRINVSQYTDRDGNARTSQQVAVGQFAVEAFGKATRQKIEAAKAAKAAKTEEAPAVAPVIDLDETESMELPF